VNRLIIDTDPGLDDAHAILMALTTVGGNVPLERTVANACTILDIAGRDAPIYAGCAGGLVRDSERAAHVHGDDGLGNSNYPPSRRAVSSKHAVQALIDHADAEPGELTLVAIGPLTNVALATRLDPTLPMKYRKLVIMGGAIRAMGNTASVAAEFNIYADPEAAAIVLNAWPMVTLVSWETTMDVGLPFDDWRAMLARDTPRAEFLRRITQRISDYAENVLKRTHMYSADPLAMAVVLDPDIVQHAELRRVDVELAGHHTRGQTVVDWFGRTNLPPNAEILLDVDRERHRALLESAML
jgi:purine nucleosidase